MEKQLIIRKLISELLPICDEYDAEYVIEAFLSGLASFANNSDTPDILYKYFRSELKCYKQMIKKVKFCEFDGN